MTNWRIHEGDCVEAMSSMEEQTIHTCVTSPPYFGLRDYGVDGQVGAEDTPQAFVEKMVEVFAAVRRVLRDDGPVWLNLGDSYAAQRSGTAMPAETIAGGQSGQSVNGRGNRGRGDASATGVDGKTRRPAGSGPAHRNAAAIGLKHKDLIGIPWRVALALQADGWYLRQDIIWHKPNPAPESVRDRCTKSHEYIFLLSKSDKYYYDAESIKEKSKSDSNASKNKRSVWSVNAKAFRGAHFAVFPTELINPCVLAGCPEGGTVLDPFAGAGTTGLVSVRNGRNFIGCELNPEYAKMAGERISGDSPLFSGVA